jgi:hypothetical protein
MMRLPQAQRKKGRSKAMLDITARKKYKIKI